MQGRATPWRTLSTEKAPFGALVLSHVAFSSCFLPVFMFTINVPLLPRRPWPPRARARDVAERAIGRGDGERASATSPVTA